MFVFVLFVLFVCLFVATAQIQCCECCVDPQHLCQCLCSFIINLNVCLFLFVFPFSKSLLGCVSFFVCFFVVVVVVDGFSPPRLRQVGLVLTSSALPSICVPLG